MSGRRSFANGNGPNGSGYACGIHTAPPRGPKLSGLVFFPQTTSYEFP